MDENRKKMIEAYTKQLKDRIDGTNKPKTKYLKIQAGETKYLRILPDDKTVFDVETGTHWEIDPRNPEDFYGCPLVNQKLPCPFCEKAFEFLPDKKKGDVHANEMFKHFISKKRFACNVVDLKNKKEGVFLWTYPWMVHVQLWNLCGSADSEQGFQDIADVKEGFNLKVTRIGNITTVVPDSKPTAIDEQFLALRYDLHTMFNAKPYEELMSVLEGIDLDTIQPRTLGKPAALKQIAPKAAAPAAETPKALPKPVAKPVAKAPVDPVEENASVELDFTPNEDAMSEPEELVDQSDEVDSFLDD